MGNTYDEDVRLCQQEIRRLRSVVRELEERKDDFLRIVLDAEQSARKDFEQASTLTGDSSDQTYAAKHYYAALRDLREEMGLVPLNEPGEKKEGGKQETEDPAAGTGVQEFNIWIHGDDLCRISAQSCLTTIRSLSDEACITDIKVLLSELQRITTSCEALGMRASFIVANAQVGNGGRDAQKGVNHV